MRRSLPVIWAKPCNIPSFAISRLAFREPSFVILQTSVWPLGAFFLCSLFLLADPSTDPGARENRDFSVRTASLQSAPEETILVDPSAPAHPFPHFWEEMF